MSGWLDEEEAVVRLRRWLDETRAEGERAGNDGRLEGDVCPPLADFDWLEVLAEFTALRHEVKLHTKSVRGLENETSRALAGLERAVAEFRSVQANEAEAAQRAGRPLVEAIVELHEAIERGAAAVRAALQRIDDACQQTRQECAGRIARLPWWQRWLARWWVRRRLYTDSLALWQAHAESVREMFRALADGYFLGALRIQRIMQENKITRIETLGRPFDPNLMTAVEVAEAAGVPAGHVAGELRPGYLWHDKVVRFAEVQVARPPSEALPPPGPPESEQEPRSRGNGCT